MKQKHTPIQVRLPHVFLKEIDKHIELGLYTNRSEAIRDAVRRRFCG